MSLLTNVFELPVLKQINSVGGFVFGSLGGVLTYFLFRFNTLFKEAIALFDLKWWHILIVSMIIMKVY